MRFGLIGYPIEHSLSPELFKAGYAGKFPYDLIMEKDFETAYRRFLDGYDGVNVTAPFKECACARADILSPECIKTGAANILLKTSGGVKAFNSDYLGVSGWLKERQKEIKALHQTDGMRVLVVGAGGAGKAAYAAAADLGAEAVTLNRTIHDDSIRPLKDFRECVLKADVVIYTLPVGIPELECLLEDQPQCAGHPIHILEANYRNPSFSESMIRKIMELRPGSSYTGGKTWLLNQAVTGYGIFTGEKPDSEKMSACL